MSLQSRIQAAEAREGPHERLERSYRQGFPRQLGQTRIERFRERFQKEFRKFASDRCWHGLDGTHEPCGPHCTW